MLEEGMFIYEFQKCLGWCEKEILELWLPPITWLSSTNLALNLQPIQRKI